MQKKELDTPCLLVERRVLTRNISSMAEMARKNNINLRPHIKTHKSPEIALLQGEQGFPGITAAKLGEAEVMAAAGIDDILIAYPLIGKKKIERLYRLAQKITVRSGVDSLIGARALSRYGEEHGFVFRVFLIVDTGKKRCGVNPDQEGVEIAREIDSLPGIKLEGIFTHEGHVYNELTVEEIGRLSRAVSQTVVEFADMLRKAGIEIATVSIGSTPTAKSGKFAQGVTELRPGTYVFNDYNMVKLGMAAVEDCALTVLATVVSKPSPNRVIIDAGSKSLTSDPGLIREGFKRGHGYINGKPGASIVSLSEEHGILELKDPGCLEIGDRLEIIPDHVCPVVNLFDEFYLVEEGRVLDRWEIKARGKVR